MPFPFLPSFIKIEGGNSGYLPNYLWIGVIVVFIAAYAFFGSKRGASLPRVFHFAAAAGLLGAAIFLWVLHPRPALFSTWRARYASGEELGFYLRPAGSGVIAKGEGDLYLHFAKPYRIIFASRDPLRRIKLKVGSEKGDHTARLTFFDKPIDVVPTSREFRLLQFEPQAAYRWRGLYVYDIDIDLRHSSDEFMLDAPYLLQITPVRNRSPRREPGARAAAEGDGRIVRRDSMENEGADLLRGVDEISRVVLPQELPAMEAPADGDDVDGNFLAGLDVADFIADINHIVLPQAVFLEKMEKGSVLAQEVGFGMNEIEDVQSARPEELADVLLGIRGQDAQPESPRFQFQNKVEDAGKKSHFVHPVMELFLRAQHEGRDLEQGDFILFNDFGVGQSAQVLDIPVVQGLDMELFRVFVDHPDDGGESIGDRAVEIENQRAGMRPSRGTDQGLFGGEFTRHAHMALTYCTARFLGCQTAERRQGAARQAPAGLRG